LRGEEALPVARGAARSVLGGTEASGDDFLSDEILFAKATVESHCRDLGLGDHPVDPGLPDTVTIEY
jgi:hypothetical protein